MGLIVIGDVHGEFGTLTRLLKKVEAKWPGSQVCFTGDVCDRGSDSDKVIDLIIEKKYDCVLGNHDLWLKKYLLGTIDPIWLHESNGGVATLQSLNEENKSRILDWLLALPLSITYNEVKVEGLPVTVSHAPLDSEPEELDRLSIWNQRFVKRFYNERFGVFGHLNVAKPWGRRNAIYIDTGCGCGGYLSAVKLPELEFLSEGEWDPSIIERQRHLLADHNRKHCWLKI